MRSLLALLAIGMFVVTIGCNNDEKPAGGDKPAAGDKKDDDKKEGSASTTEPSAKMVEVSLKLPNVS